MMTELEKKVVKRLIDDGTIWFYTQFVDDTLILIKEEDIDRVCIMYICKFRWRSQNFPDDPCPVH